VKVFAAYNNPHPDEKGIFPMSNFTDYPTLDGADPSKSLDRYTPHLRGHRHAPISIPKEGTP